jgi:Sortase domain
MRSNHRGLLATVVAVIFALGGASAIVVAVAAQNHAPQPPPAAAGSLGPVDTHVRRSASPALTAVGPVLRRSKPVRIDIPAIAVHSPLLQLGETAGAVDVPSGSTYNEAGWYKYSPTPGSLGPAVILGHVDSGASGPSVFFKLGDLRPGDRVFVTRADGLVAVFQVSGVHHFPKADFPTQLVYGNTDFAALRLITCGGSFDWSTGHYVDNIVVFASLVAFHKA